MPVLRNHVVVDIARGLRAFVSLDAGLTRGPAPENPQQAVERLSRQLQQTRNGIGRRERQIEHLRKRLSTGPDEKKAAAPPAQARVPGGSRPSKKESLPKVDRLEAFRDLLGPMKPGRLLDLGAGHGKFSLVARELGWEVTAVDARVERMPDTPGIEWVQSDVREFEIGDGYDCICVLGLLYHLELEDQLDLLRRCAGTTTIIDTHTAARPEVERDGYDGKIFKEVPGATQEERAATATAAWGNETAFWPTEESLMQMARDTGFSAVFKMEPPHAPNRTFYLCLGGKT